MQSVRFAEETLRSISRKEEGRSDTRPQAWHLLKIKREQASNILMFGFHTGTMGSIPGRATHPAVRTATLGVLTAQEKMSTVNAHISSEQARAF